MGLDNILYQGKQGDKFVGIEEKELTDILSNLTVGYLVEEMGLINSFRGKVYAEYVEKYTGKSLYKSADFTLKDYKHIVEQLTIDVASRLGWEKVNAEIKASYKNGYGHSIPVDELESLLNLFKYCVIKKQRHGNDFVMDAWN